MDVTASAGALAPALAVLLVLQTLVWLASLRARDAGLADVFWGPGIAVVAWLYVALAPDPGVRGVVAASCVTIWAARLALHLLWRGRGRGEDPRYGAMRAHHGRRFWWVSAFTVFWLQGGIQWVIAFPLLAAQRPAPLGWWDAVGLVCFAAGFLCETIADWQLTRFRGNPANRGTVLDSGLWRYSRHPNYFGDALLWWGMFCFAAAVGGWWTVVSPALMTFLLLRVSGVTLLERSLTASRPAYREYVARTSAFVPLPPRRHPA